MKLKNRLRFRELQIIFTEGLMKYPNDAERAERGLQLLEKLIDEIVQDELSELFQKNAVITHRGEKKGGGGSFTN
jgi:hypothetical protein